jgi:branched-chain amino acid transport system ATP-binding protein
VLEGLSAGYHGLQILHELDLRVDAGEIVALVGANGAGKTTTLRAISGVVRPSSGTITFGPLTVEENLRMGAWTQKGGAVASGLSEVFELFPILAERRRQAAETMSGGQQQMLAIGRALMARPKLLMLDEPSTGLSPKLTWAVLDAVRTIRDRGVAVLLVEQNAHQALRMSDRAYVLESGSCVLSGPGPELAEDDRVRSAYLGL